MAVVRLKGQKRAAVEYDATSYVISGEWLTLIGGDGKPKGSVRIDKYDTVTIEIGKSGGAIVV